MHTTLSAVTVQRFCALQGERIGLVEQDYAGLTPKLEQIIRAFEFTQIELAVYRDRGYAQGRGVGQPQADRCALACAFLAKAVLDLKTTRALIERLQADSKLRRLCGFDLRFALPSESTFSRAFDAFASAELIQRVHARMIQDTLGEQLIGHISRDSTAIDARESIVKQDKAQVLPAKPKNKRGRPAKREVRPTPEHSPLHRQRGQTQHLGQSRVQRQFAVTCEGLPRVKQGEIHAIMCCIARNPLRVLKKAAHGLIQAETVSNSASPSLI
jgi:hypothetical protein